MPWNGLPSGIKDLTDVQIPNRVRKLRGFLGSGAVNVALRRYRKSIKVSRPIYADYYLKKRHPWWESWVAFDELSRSGKVIYKNLTEEMVLLGRDAHYISHLQATMAEPVRAKYRAVLLDDKRASDYLLELHAAWSFFSRGEEILWVDADRETGHEFTVGSGEKSFNVECKAVSADISRKIKREHFYRFFDKFVSAFWDRELSGYVSLELADPLPSADAEIDQILSVVKDCTSIGTGDCDADVGRIEWGILESGAPQEQHQSLRERFNRTVSANAETAIISRDARLSNSLALTMSCRKRSSVVRAIMKKLGEVGKREQLPKGQAGLIVCHIPEVPDYSNLGTGSSLADMMNLLLNRDYMRQVAVVHFISDPRSTPTQLGSVIGGQVLTFENPNSPFVGLSDVMKL